MWLRYRESLDGKSEKAATMSGATTRRRKARLSGLQLPAGRASASGAKTSSRDCEWVVYVLECRDQSLYTGITNRPLARLLAHQEGKGARYTRGRGPLRLVYMETGFDRSAALKRELALKKLPRKKKIEIIMKGAMPDRSPISVSVRAEKPRGRRPLQRNHP
jgi:putative endonuclease